ncbi:MAG: WD40/YVTN/BNR-like repeat-containing protein, partial [Nocardioidaceae bacterium]
MLFVAGFEGLFRSEDDGGRWTEIQTHAEYVVGLGVSPDHENDATAIVTTYVKGTYATNDGGATWVERNVIVGSPSGNDFAPVARLGNVHFSPNYVEDGTVFSATHLFMLKSTDRGASWTKIQVGDYPTTTYRQFITAVSPAYAQDQTAYVGTRQGDIYRSSSGGEAGTWSLLANLGARVRSLVLSPQFPAEPVIYASTSNGIFKSDDAGAHWQPTGPAGISMLAISSDYSSDGTVFAGTESGVFVTRDEGATWTELVAAPLSTSTNVEAIAVSPTYGADHTVLVSVLGTGLYRSTDGGTTFAAVGTSLIQNNHMITDYENPVSTPIQFSPTYARDRTIFGMAQDDIVRSTDGGDSWQVLNLPPAANFLKPPVVAAAPVAAEVTEGAGGTTGVIRIPFDLTHPYASTVTVNWRTLDVPDNPQLASSAAGDYVAASGTLTFAKGWTRQYVNVVVNGDAI